VYEVIQPEDSGAIAYFIVFIILETFIFINLFIAVIVDNLERSHDANKKAGRKARRARRKRMQVRQQVCSTSQHLLPRLNAPCSPPPSPTAPLYRVVLGRQFALHSQYTSPFTLTLTASYSAGSSATWVMWRATTSCAIPTGPVLCRRSFQHRRTSTTTIPTPTFPTSMYRKAMELVSRDPLYSASFLELP
jgi:ion transport protein